ncbi:SAV_2336 N-terminal domain-related protein [Streptomyces sp. NPDC004111]|uniref:SAV_2336 N-terminal domain-related protein n=1 Tax=Streptomyces sp. NPDC004111 TaxID=3364690 RepID=UPI003694E529
MAGRRHTLAEGDRINSGATNAQLVALLDGLHDLGIDPHPDELADALWLARWVPPAHPDPAPGPGTPPADGAGGRTGTTGQAPPRPDVTPPRGTRVPTPPTAELAVPGPGAGPEGTGGAEGAGEGAVRVPTAAALPQPLALQRALRPLRGYRAPARSLGAEGLDEEATADRAADTGVVVPVLRGRRRRAARLQFVMDVSTSMVVWEETLQELRQICERSGAFREVRVHYVRENADGDAAFALSADPDAPLHRPQELRDPTGHRLTLVLSDCAGPLWRAGKMQELMHGWAATAPVAVVQPLPQRMWRRTHLPAVKGELVRGEGPAGRLRFHPAAGGTDDPDALPVPVLAPRPGPLRAWVRLVSGAKGQSLRTVAGWVRAEHPASAAPRRTERTATPADRVRAFRRSASPDAARLAVYLSAAPLALPVMQLVQRAMLPDSGPEVLAEVMLGGLLRRGTDTDRLIGYEFIDGVRRELLDQIAVSDAHLVLKHCSAYLELRYGRTARNFPARAAAYLAGEAHPAQPGRPGVSEEEGLRAFARVSAEVLRRFGQTVPVVSVAEATAVGTGADELALRARELIAQYTERHAARDLDEAAALLRAAVEASPDPGALHAELGALLYLRWEVRQTAEDLRGALEQFARTRPGTLNAALLRVWHAALVAVASEVEVTGAGTPALPDSVREQEGEPYRAQRLRMRLWRQALDCLKEAKPKRDPASRDDDTVYPNALLTLRVMASWGADPAFTALLREEHDGPAEWTARMLGEAVFTALSWTSRDWPARLEHCAGLLLDRARHLLGQGEVRWEPGPEYRAEGRRQAGSAVETYRELIDALYRDRGGEPLVAGGGPFRAQEGPWPVGPAPEAPGEPAPGAEEPYEEEAGPGTAERYRQGAGPLDDAPPAAPFPDDDRNPYLDEYTDLYGTPPSGAPEGLSRHPGSPRASEPDQDYGPERDEDLAQGYGRERDEDLAQGYGSSDGPGPSPEPGDGSGQGPRAGLGNGSEQDPGLQQGRYPQQDPAPAEGHGSASAFPPVGPGPVPYTPAEQRDHEAHEARAALDRRIATALLGLAGALQLHGNGAAEAEEERLRLLRLALALSREERELRTLTLQHLAWALADAYARTGEREHLVEEIDAWWASLAGLEPDSEFYPYALKSLGDALIEAEEWDDAVRMMREAVDSTADADPELAGRRMALGHALLTRYVMRGGQSDLHEADWLLGAAARAGEGTEIAAASWRLRAQVAEEQARRGGSAARWIDAADYYRRAAEAAEEAHRPEIAAGSRHYRAKILERTAGPARALAEYREAVHLYAEAGEQDTEEAADARAAVRRLTGGRA